MRKVGKIPNPCLSFNTCQHNGRTFHVSADGEKKLCIGELILGEEARYVHVATGVSCKLGYVWRMACCSFGQYILVMTGKEGANRPSSSDDDSRSSVTSQSSSMSSTLSSEREQDFVEVEGSQDDSDESGTSDWSESGSVTSSDDQGNSDSSHSSEQPAGNTLKAGKEYVVFAALVEVDEGPLDASTLHATELTVEGDKEWSDTPYLCSVSDSRALLYFNDQGDMWYCDVTARTLTMKKLKTRIPDTGGFNNLPLHLPDGRLLVTEGWYPYDKGIIVITPGEVPAFEKIGEIPGQPRYWTSTVLIGGRFMVGFGGLNDSRPGDIWIFDFQTRRGSAVTSEGEWHPPDILVPLVVQGGTLYLADGPIYSISLQALSELIQDIDVQAAFQTSLGLEPRRYPPIEQEACDFPGMHDLGGYFPGYLSYNTIDHEGRVFHFSQEQKKLCVTEIILGPRLKVRSINTGIDCEIDEDQFISCCSFGDKILVIAGSALYHAAFCALVSIGSGDLSKESIHIEEKVVQQPDKWAAWQSLAQISETEVWIRERCAIGIWVLEIKGQEVNKKIHPLRDVAVNEFRIGPLRVPGGRLLGMGGGFKSKDIALINPADQFSIEEIGNLLNKREHGVSVVLLKERFVIGFGGYNGVEYQDDMWIFDMQTHITSAVRKEGDWPPTDPSLSMVVRGQALYALGGGDTTNARYLSFEALSCLIEKSDMRYAFRLSVGVQFPSNKELKRNTIMKCIHLCL